MESRDGKSEEIDTEDGLDQLHNGESGENDGQTDEGIGNLVTGGFNGLLVALGHDPFEDLPK